jgi:hypothetical protein
MMVCLVCGREHVQEVSVCYDCNQKGYSFDSQTRQIAFQGIDTGKTILDEEDKKLYDTISRWKYKKS